jgi:hypothetical protein
MRVAKRPKGKRGPKPRPEAEIRRHVVAVKLNDSELERLQGFASPLPVSTWLRHLGLQAVELAGLREEVQAELQRMRETTTAGEEHLRETRALLEELRKTKTKS